MNTRRSVIATLAAVGLPGASRAGAVDWINRVKVGTTLPDFETRYLNNPPATDARLLLIDFWATWCADCQDHIPTFNAWHAQYRAQGLSIIGLTKEPPEIAVPFLARVRMNYAVGAGETHNLQSALGVRALPYAVLVDPAKTIVWRGQPLSLSEAMVEALLRKSV